MKTEEIVRKCVPFVIGTERRLRLILKPEPFFFALPADCSLWLHCSTIISVLPPKAPMVSYRSFASHILLCIWILNIQPSFVKKKSNENIQLVVWALCFHATVHDILFFWKTDKLFTMASRLRVAIIQSRAATSRSRSLVSMTGSHLVIRTCQLTKPALVFRPRFERESTFTREGNGCV